MQIQLRVAMPLPRGVDEQEPVATEAERTALACLPEVEDQVLVVFAHGDLRDPVSIGSLWNGGDTPPEKNAPTPKHKVLRDAD